MVPNAASLRSYMSSPRPDKPILCLVCSDKSFGNNFGAITCESCKAFFRRTANERDKLACPFNDNCEITITTRKHCRKCRLEKCFNMGMIKEWIQSEEQLKIRRAILKERKMRRDMSMNAPPLKRVKPCGLADGPEGAVKSSSSLSSGNIEEGTTSSATSDSSLPIETRTGAYWAITPSDRVDGSRINRASQSSLTHNPWLASASSRKVCIQPTSASSPEKRQSVAQFFNKITDRNFFAHLVKSNETSAHSSRNPHRPTYILPRSSVITFTGKSNSPSFHHDTNLNSPSKETGKQTALPTALDSLRGETTNSTSTLCSSTHAYQDCLPTDQSKSLRESNLSPTKAIPTLTRNPFVFTRSSLSVPCSTYPRVRSTSPLSDISSYSLDKSSYVKTSKIEETLVGGESLFGSSMGSLINEEKDKKCSKVDESSSRTNLFSTFEPTSLELSRSSTLNVFHHIIDSYFTRMNMRSERQMKSLALTSMEETRLIELTLAYGVFNDPLPIDFISSSSTILPDCFNISVRQLMAMTRKLTAFTALPIEDQDLVFRNSYCDIISMKGTFIFDFVALGWPIKGTGSSLTFESMREIDNEFYQKYIALTREMDPTWRSNLMVNQLIVAIMLFNCTLSGLKCRESIRLEYCAYIYLLQRYLESSRTFQDEPKETLCAILGKINDIQILTENKPRISSDRCLNFMKFGFLESLLTPD